MPTYAKNSLAQVVAYEEVTYGIVPAGPGLQARLISHSLSQAETLNESPEIRPGRNPGVPFEDGKTISGSLVLLADPVDLGFWLKWGIGEPATSGAGPFDHVFTVDPALKSLTLELIWTGIAQIWQVTGVKITSIGINIGTSGLMQITLNVLAAAVTKIALASRIDAAPYQAAGDRLRLRGSTLGIGASPTPVDIPHFSSFDIQIDNQIEGYEAVPTEGYYDLSEGVIQVSGSATVLIDSTDPYWALHDAKTEVSLLAQLVSPSGATIDITVAEALLSMAIPSVQGTTGYTPGQLTFRGYVDDDADDSAVKVDLQNGLASYAAIPA